MRLGMEPPRLCRLGALRSPRRGVAWTSTQQSGLPLPPPSRQSTWPAVTCGASALRSPLAGPSAPLRLVAG